MYINRISVTLFRTCALLYVGGLTCMQAQAASATQASEPQAAGYYLEHPAGKAFVAEVTGEQTYPKAKLEALLASAQKSQSILDAIARPAEKTKTWAEYRPIFLTQDRIDQGVAFYQQHQDTFLQAEQTFGVSRFMILAIMGVETRYGKHMGNYRVVDALATLAFDYPPRSRFFRSELKHFLHLEQEAGIDLMSAKGSYAGAMGYGQFISSSYRHYAVDFDNDGHRDLLNNPVDAIGSVANYFKRHGWQPGRPVASLARFLGDEQQQAQLAKVISPGPKPQKPNLTILEIEQAGLVADAEFAGQEPATAMAFEGAEGVEYWIGLQNFYVITRYNHSPLYAMAVYQLSEELKQRLSL
ncbi:lytic murein transglycosylase B [Ketobacter sp.]|uniref:lytic murein transglycosylase B n=1 Tax=Ketobacter sp. TaxID=2083498 RepID=UPI0025B80156|nr:lytic murein transglycosylase B [Ketobacter sp.]